MKIKKYIIPVVLVFISNVLINAAKVEFLSIYSDAMGKDIKVEVIVPDIKKNLAAVYMLHGYSDNENFWLETKSKIKRYSDKFGLLIVCLDDDNNWYGNNELNPKSKFETFLSHELVKYIDIQYPTNPDRKFRAITGLGMGGYGAVWLAFRNPEVFGVVGSINGALDSKASSKNKKILEEFVAINQIKNLKKNKLNIVVSCDDDDYSLDVNNSFHQKLLQNGIKHEYIVIPKENSAIDYHLEFFNEKFEQYRNFYSNPVITGELADPSIIRVNDTYFATGTSSEWAPFYPTFSSTDLVNWKQEGHIFNKQPEWTLNSFWAPELFYHNNKFYCYYTARRKSDGISYIGVATSDSAKNEFVDHGVLIEYGREAIDAFVYDDNGQLYISWKAYGLDNRPIEILASKLSKDGLKLEGKIFSLLKDDERIGMEGQYHFKKGEYYYLIYAARGCCGFGSDYEVSVARSKKYEGPYEKYVSNPILRGANGDFISSGHGTVVTTPDNRMFYMCHAYSNNAERFCGRRPVVYEIYIDDQNWIAFKGGNQAQSLSHFPFDNMYQKSIQNFEDNFDSEELKVDWTWNYPFSDVKIDTKKGKLYLSGSSKSQNHNASVLCLRPQTADYDYQTQIQSENDSFNGLTMYGDNENFIAWGIEDGKWILKRIENKNEILLYSSSNENKNSHVKIRVIDGCKLDFYYSEDNDKWISILEAPINCEYLTRWDRVARPGLIHMGHVQKPAVFTYFKLNNY